MPLARILANTVEGIAKLRGAKNPPFINKARYKFVGLHLDYSIEKARRVLGYQPPFTFEEAHRARHGRAPSRRLAQSPQPAVATSESS